MAITIKDEAFAMQNQIVEWRREFHQCPELKMDTVETAKIIVRVLKEIGITEIKTQVGGPGGVTAVIRGALPGKTLGIRVDCDGLPIQEQTGLPFASTNGNMHACGHDAHVAMGLGAARLIHSHRDKLKGAVKIIFQPYEEGDGGAKAMIAGGAMEDPKIDAMIAMHTGNIMGSEFKSGDICWCRTIASFCITAFWAKFRGKKSHVASPHLGIDPVLTACYAVTQLQSIMSRERNPANTAIVSVSVIHGGERNNIIPDECYIEGTIRSADREEQSFYYQRMKEIFEGTAKGMRCSVEVGKTFDLMSTKIDAKMLQKFLEIAPKVISASKIKEIKELAPCGEDFARFADIVPSLYFYHCSAFEDGYNYPHHHPKFNINEDTLWSGAALFTQFALDWQN